MTDPDATVPPPGEVSTISGQPSTPVDAPMFGNYRLLQKLGEGGMGEVWAAEQERPMRRKVAIKVIKAGMDSREVLARFESERQALALMNHPNIARVFEAGESSHGRPFFVMELVEGVPVTQYCDSNRLNTEERLALFVQICDAVQHAHHKGVIHRDIKPSNVLVRIQDQTPVPKIIDFGIAKATAQPLTEMTMFTEIGVVVGTPAYMSPEQAERTGLDVDTRTDVYSLGMLLYELLVGVLPFDAGGPGDSDAAELRRRIREDEPTKPSTRLTSLGESSLELARLRRADLRTLGRQLRGDLDWITLKALEKDRTRRYGSPNELAADVGRHLRHEPVLAGPPAVRYRVGKFIRRHRVGVAAASLILAAVLFGTGAAAYGLVRARRAESAARQEAAKAAAVNEFLQEMLASADPFGYGTGNRGPNLTVLEALGAAAKKVDSGALKDQPLVEAAVRRTIGAAYTNLGNYAAAEPHLLAAVSVSTRAGGEAHPDTGESLMMLGNLRRAQGQFAESETVIRRALATQRAALGAQHLKVGEAAQSLAVTLVELRKVAEAETFEREALAIYRQRFGNENPYTASSLNNLAAMMIAQRRLAEAEPLAREALAIQRKTQGSDTPDIAVEMQNYGALLRDLGRYADAEPLLREALALVRKHLGNDHEAVARVGNNLAGVLRDEGKPAEAEPIYREALAIDRRNRPAGDPRLAFALTGLGWVLTDLDRPAEAEPLLREAVAIREKQPPGDWRLPYSRMLLGSALAGQKKFREAEPLAVNGYTAMAANKDTPSQWTRQSLQNVVRLYETWDRAEPNASHAAKAAEWRARLK
jgi:eukaryotic-like serine/threonine-protein kinase